MRMRQRMHMYMCICNMRMFCHCCTFTCVCVSTCLAPCIPFHRTCLCRHLELALRESPNQAALRWSWCARARLLVCWCRVLLHGGRGEGEGGKVAGNRRALRLNQRC